MRRAGGVLQRYGRQGLLRCVMSGPVSRREFIVLAEIRPSEALYCIKEGQARSVPGGGLLPFGRGKPSINRVHARCLLNTTKVEEQSSNLVSTVPCSLVVHAYRTQRARPLTYRLSFLHREYWACLAVGGSGATRLSGSHS